MPVSPSYRIVEYDPRWPAIFEDEKARIVFALGIEPQQVQHVGSTSIPCLGAKPIVDIMVGIPTMDSAERYARLLSYIGYEWRGETVPGTLYIRKAVPRRFNIHMTQYGSDFWLEDLLFRDYLRVHPEAVREYEALKRKLMATLASDPPAYNAGKAAFIRSIVDKARAEFNPARV
ncbi:MAG: GrpB family protein [Chloroflexi bacterium]|nr:GrpB family protein [Chloroflexota bacterium]